MSGLDIFGMVVAIVFTISLLLTIIGLCFDWDELLEGLFMGIMCTSFLFFLYPYLFFLVRTSVDNSKQSTDTQTSPNVTVTIDGKQYSPVQNQQIEVTIDGKTYQLTAK